MGGGRNKKNPRGGGGARGLPGDETHGYGKRYEVTPSANGKRALMEMETFLFDQKTKTAKKRKEKL